MPTLCFTDVYSSLKTTSSHNLHTSKHITSKNPCSCVCSVIVHLILDLTLRIRLTVQHHQLDFGKAPLASQQRKCHLPLMFIFDPNLFIKWVLAYSVYNIIFMILILYSTSCGLLYCHPGGTSLHKLFIGYWI